MTTQWGIRGRACQSDPPRHSERQEKELQAEKELDKQHRRIDPCGSNGESGDREIIRFPNDQCYGTGEVEFTEVKQCTMWDCARVICCFSRIKLYDISAVLCCV